MTRALEFSDIIDFFGENLWDRGLGWLKEKALELYLDLISFLGKTGGELFDEPVIKGFLSLFRNLGFALFVVALGMVAYEVAVSSRGDWSTLRPHLLYLLYGLLASGLCTVLPPLLYSYSLSLQETFMEDLNQLYMASGGNLGDLLLWTSKTYGLMITIVVIYCVLHVFLSTIKRGGILLIQMAVGSLHIFSLTRGEPDGFLRWMRQVIALCLTTFVQMTVFYLGTVGVFSSPIMGVGLLLAAKDVPKILDQFGLDTSARGGVRSAASGAIRTVKMIAMLPK